MSTVQIENVNVGDINPAKYNPRKISKEAIEGLKASILRFGIQDPLIVNSRTGNLVGGHQRLRAIKELGINQCPVNKIDLSDIEEKALNIALNSKHISGEFDVPQLEFLLEELRIELPEFDALRFNEFELEFDIDQEIEPPIDESSSSESAKEKCQLIIDCTGEAEQEILYNKLLQDGIKSQIVNR